MSFSSFRLGAFTGLFLTACLSCFSKTPSPFRYLARLGLLAAKMEREEVAKVKLSWVVKGQLLAIGKVEVSAHILKEAVAGVTKRVTDILNDLTFHANLQLKRAWGADVLREDPNNMAQYFSPITDRGDVILDHLSKLARVCEYLSMCAALLGGFSPLFSFVF